MKKKNVTVQLEENLLKHSRHLAVDQDMSLSEWISKLVEEAVRKSATRESSRRRAFAVLSRPLRLGGTTYTRDELHDR